MQTYAYGFPRLGPNREYKRCIESFWKNENTEQQTRDELAALEQQMLQIYERYVDRYPVGEMTQYDPMLDTAIMVGLYRPSNLQEYYDLCRGADALEMTKWCNTNYHYLEPDFSALENPSFDLHWNKPAEALQKNQQGLPYVIGPFTFLKLSKGLDPEQFETRLANLQDVYKRIFTELDEVHVDEPALVLDLTEKEVDLFCKTYKGFSDCNCKINLFTYYDCVDCLPKLYDLPLAGIGLDFVHNPENFDWIAKRGFPEDKILYAGVIDGRNVWRYDPGKVVPIIEGLNRNIDNIVLTNSGPLYHLPYSVENESFKPELQNRLAFAVEKLLELKTLSETMGKPQGAQSQHAGSAQRAAAEPAKIDRIPDEEFRKQTPYLKRRTLQQDKLNLPLFPTTTIGSFPQTREVRKMRADYRKGNISEKEYRSYIQEKIQELVDFQHELGLDVLVHGEFERTDMVEFFAEKLEGVATSKNGWIISYGTRGYRPPIVYDTVNRPEPMTVEEIAYAQTLTDKPVKGMLTGAVTILAWSFVRDDVPVQEVAWQIASCLRQEIQDYEKAGIQIVQVDEPAFREKAPLKRRNWPAYFEWAVKSFRLTTNTDPATQIHTHMCYSEFGEIVEHIQDMDFDVISVEATRSKGDIIESFEQSKFDRQIGLGVWDIHSPAIPSVKQMEEIVDRALKVIPAENFWINPDCGLKTRDWPETKESLKNLTELAGQIRSKTA